MAELSGSLLSFELAALVRFLCGLGKSGDLLVSHGRWVGQLSLDRGRLSAAAVDDEHGPAALEFIAAAMRAGDFDFSEGPPTLAPNLDGDPLVLLERVATTAPPAWLSVLPAPTDVPGVVAAGAADDAEVALGRAAIYVLLQVDGARTVRDLGARYGLLRTLTALARLREVDLISFDTPRPGPSEPPAARPGSFDPSPAVPAPGRPESFDSGSAGPGNSSLSLWERAGVRGTSGRPGPASGIGPDRPGSPEPGSGGAQPRRFTRQSASAEQSDGPPAEPRAGWRDRFIPGRPFALGVELAQSVVLAGLLILGIRTVVQNFRVEGSSMQPNFSGGQALVVNRAVYFHVERTPLAQVLPTTSQGSTQYVFGGPRRGDVVVFRAPPQPDTDYIKRIIGLPGETVQITQGRVFINGERLVEPYVDFPASYNFPEDDEPAVVPDGSYFVLGDNRPDSFDSHQWGFVPVENLIGRAWLRYWPPDELGTVQPTPPLQASSSIAAR